MAKVKICGNTQLEDVKRAIELGADFLGFIFVESKRKLTIEQAKSILSDVPDFDNFVGVFANQPKEEVEEIASSLKLKWLQFHGEETSRYCHYFNERGYQVIKTFRIRNPMSLKRIDEYNVAAFLFDTYSKEVMGGSGISFDWSIIEDRPYVHDKLFLSGGLNINNLPKALEQVNPYAVDVASGVEKSPGIKDHKLLETFIALAKRKDSVRR